MPVSTQIPESWRIPLFWATVDGSQAGNLTQNQPALLVGQMLSTGTATPNVPVAIGSPALGQVLFGRGSMLDRMIQSFFQVNVNQLLYAIGVSDPGSGNAATGTITVATPPTASGTIFLYIAGQLVQVAVNATDIVGTVATNIAAAITADVDLPVDASAAGAVVSLTCQWKGLTGNDITLIANYRGPSSGEVFPTGLTLTMASQLTGGTSQPSFTTAIANIQPYPYLYVGFPYTDSTSMLAWATEYGFGATGRWSYSRQQYGFCVNAYRNDYADTITFGIGNNSPVLSTMAIEQLCPSPVWEVAAAYCGLAALGFSDDPARPLQTLEMVGILPASLSNRYSQAQQNNLINSGMAAQFVAPDGNMAILTEQTQYQLNSYGQGDTAFGLLTILATLASLLTSFKASITTKFPRVKLLPNGTAYGPGQAVVTPIVLAAEIVAEYQLACYNGLASNLPAFIKNLIVEIDDQNPNRVNVLYPPTLAGQLRVFAALAQFRLLASPISVAVI